MVYPSAEPSQTSDGKCACSVMREPLMATASVYESIGIQGLPRCRYRSATIVATDHTAVECPEGKLLPFSGDLPPLKNVPVNGAPRGTSAGRCLRVTALIARLTTTVSP